MELEASLGGIEGLRRFRVAELRRVRLVQARLKRTILVQAERRRAGLGLHDLLGRIGLARDIAPSAIAALTHS